MNYAEFKAILPNSPVTEEEFNKLIDVAIFTINSLIVYSFEELSEKGRLVYNKALALQIQHFQQFGVNEGNITGQNINGVSVSFLVSGENKTNVSDTVKGMLTGLMARC